MTEQEIHHAVMVVRNALMNGKDGPPPSEVFELVAQLLMDIHVIADVHRKDNGAAT